MLFPWEGFGAYVVLRNLTGHTIERGEWVSTLHSKVVFHEDNVDRKVFHHVDVSADENILHGSYGRFRLKSATFL